MKILTIKKYSFKPVLINKYFLLNINVLLQEVISFWWETAAQTFESIWEELFVIFVINALILTFEKLQMSENELEL